MSPTQRRIIASTKITAHCFEFGTDKYFRGNAHNVDIGSYGEKKDPIGANAYVDVQNKVKLEELAKHVKFNLRTKVNWNESSKADVETNGQFKYFGVTGAAALSGGYEKAKSANLELINFAIDETPLQKMLNHDAPGALKFFADEGGDARIASEVWIVVDAELAEQFANYGATSASVKAGKDGLSISVSGGKNGAQTMTLSKGTTFACKLHKVKDWNKGKTQIENMEADWKGWQ